MKKTRLFLIALPFFLFAVIDFNSDVWAQQETRNDKKVSEKEIAKLLQDLITDDKTVQRKILENLKKIDKNIIIEFCKKVLRGTIPPKQWTQRRDGANIGTVSGTEVSNGRREAETQF